MLGPPQPESLAIKNVHVGTGMTIFSQNGAIWFHSSSERTPQALPQASNESCPGWVKLQTSRPKHEENSVFPNA